MSIARAASNATPAQPPAAPARRGEQKMVIFLLNGTRTSAGNGPGALEVPAAEGSALIAAHLAVAGSRPPEGFQGAS